MPRKTTKRVAVEAFTHDDTRVNIPTSETSGFMTDAQREGEPKTYQRYRRDPARDPQLVWRGKDEADATDLEVFVRPIYVTEKIQPRAIIENVRAVAAEGMPFNLELFGDFNGIAFEDQVDFYNHEQHWQNRMILGDSLAAMASLVEREGMRSKVQMIYIDPPYGIKFNSNWQPSTVKRDVKDGRDVTYEPEQIRAFRDTWEDGIHSYLSYLRDRLRLARELLTDTGSIFVQIGDENIHLVRNLLDEVFGADNFCAVITVIKTAGQSSELLPNVCDYLIWYARNKTSIKYHQIFRNKLNTSGDVGGYSWAELLNGQRRTLRKQEKADLSLLPQGFMLYSPTSLISQGETTDDRLFHYQGKSYDCGAGNHWKTNALGRHRLARASRIHVAENSVRYVRYLDDFSVIPYTNYWDDTGTGNFTEDKIYVVQTATKIIERCMLMTTDPGDLVLDPTCGSGTSAYVAEQWGRRWITMDTSRVALTLARARVMAARFPAYTLKTDRVADGFRYKTVSHITLKSIANNEKIDALHAQFQPQLEALLEQINTISPKQYQEWEVPRPSEDGEGELHELLGEWWRVRRERQDAIDAAIRENPDMETLYDQPEVRKDVVRVTGPFTVESLQPHRAENGKRKKSDGGRFLLDMIEQLRIAGVTTSRAGERLTFERLDQYPGKYVQAVGTYTQAGQTGRAAILIGPQYGTVSREMIRSAAKEAVKDREVDFDTLIACGFAFDPAVSEETRSNMGRLVVQTARIAPDLLLMGKDLKKDGRGNLFTVFGEPDVRIEQVDGRMVVRLLGMDVYDPKEHEIRASSTDEIACWFIDTNYNEESFFVRHAYFTGADNPYEKLQKALKAEIDEVAWDMLRRTESIPFDPPATGRIAVKVINHFGDEVIKVVEVS